MSEWHGLKGLKMGFNDHTPLEFIAESLGVSVCTLSALLRRTRLAPCQGHF